MNEIYESRSTRPDQIFVYEAAMKKYGILRASIIAELYYWIVQNKNPFRRYEDHANLFKFGSSAIGQAHNDLTYDEIFNRKRQYSKKHGGQLSYTYSKGPSEFSNEIYAVYSKIFVEPNGNPDLGRYYCSEEFSVKMEPKVLTLLTNTIDEFKDLTTAFIYTRLCWLAHSNSNEGKFNFDSMVTLANWLGIKRNTVERRMKSLNDSSHIEIVRTDKLYIVIDKNKNSFHEYKNWLTNTHKKRTDGFSEGFPYI